MQRLYSTTICYPEVARKEIGGQRGRWAKSILKRKKRQWRHSRLMKINDLEGQKPDDGVDAKLSGWKNTMDISVPITKVEVLFGMIMNISGTQSLMYRINVFPFPSPHAPSKWQCRSPPRAIAILSLVLYCGPAQLIRRGRSLREYPSRVCVEKPMKPRSKAQALFMREGVYCLFVDFAEV
jgi:hypothetical protein